MSLIKKYKKGELTTQQLVILIILIVSFVVILLFYFRLNFKQGTEKELCHNSVIMRGNSVLSSVKEALPLNCNTKYFCITKDGSCEKMNKPKIEKVKTKEEVYNILAEKMADCWWMFGEGKVNYVAKNFKKKNYCSICSQVAFDDSVLKVKGFEKGQINKDDFYNYLANKKISNKDITYSEYFFGTKDLNKLKEMALNQKGVGTFGVMDLNKQYFVLMGITSEVGKLSWILSGGSIGTIGTVIGVLAFSSNPIGWVSGAIILGGISVGGGIGAIVSEVSNSINPEISAIVVNGKGINNKFMAPTIIEANSDKFKSLNCASVSTLA